MLYIILIHISGFMLFFFFASELSLALYFLLILGYRNVLDKKQTQAFFFYSSSKWVVKLLNGLFY